jgi:predicted PurR-regulated permease PerM
LCAGIGFLVAGIPYAGIWTLLCLILAIIQIGIFPIVLGVLIYIWTTAHTITAILLTVWMIPVGLLDNILKPLMMGKGAPVPMLVIFLGSLGGFIYSGIVGLFTGAVILSLGYRLFDTWLKGSEI